MTTTHDKNASIDVRRAAVIGAIVVASYLAISLSGLPLDAGARAAAVCFMLPTVAALVAAVRVIPRSRGAERVFWVLMALSFASFLVAWIYRLYCVYVVRQYVPAGLVDDIGIVAGFLLLAAAAVMLVVRARPTPARLLRVTLEMAAAVLLAVALAHWAVLVPHDGFRPAPTFANMALAASSACALGVFIFTLAFSRPRRRPWTRFFVAGLAVAGLATAASLVVGVLGTERPIVAVVDATAMSAFVLLALSGVARLDPECAARPDPALFPRTPAMAGVAVPLLGLAGLTQLLWLAPAESTPGHVAPLRTLGAVAAALITTRSIAAIHERRSDHHSASRRYESVIESSPSGIIVLDLDGKIAFANQAAVAISEADREEDLIGRDWYEFTDSDGSADANRLAAARYFDELAETGTAAALVDPPATAPYLSLKDRRIWVEQTVRPIIVEGEPAVLVQVVDISARIAAERASEEHRARLGALSAELLDTTEREQRRLAEALHDEVSQPLAIARMHLTAGASDRSIEGRHAEEALRLLDMAIAHTRGLTSEISPPFLDEPGLRKALEWLAAGFATNYSLNVTVSGQIDEDALDQQARSALFRTTRQLLHNVVKHACVRDAEIILAQSDGFVSVTVVDEGVGLSDGTGSSTAGSGFGLLSIRERLPRLGGDFEIGPGPSGGVRATARLPVTPPAGQQPGAPEAS